MRWMSTCGNQLHRVLEIKLLRTATVAFRSRSHATWRGGLDLSRQRQIVQMTLVSALRGISPSMLHGPRFMTVAVYWSM